MCTCEKTMTQYVVQYFWNFLLILLKLRQFVCVEYLKIHFSIDLLPCIIIKLHNYQCKQHFLPYIFVYLQNQGKRTPSVNGFSYKDCGGIAGKITKLALTPDPLSFPGVLTVSAAVTLNTTLSSPLQVNNIKLIAPLDCIKGR